MRKCALPILDYGLHVALAFFRVLYEELKLRDQMFQEFREQKEKEIAELMAIKGDLEVRLQRVSDEREQVNGGSHIMGQFTISLTSLPLL